MFNVIIDNCIGVFLQNQQSKILKYVKINLKQKVQQEFIVINVVENQQD